MKYLRASLVGIVILAVLFTLSDERIHAQSAANFLPPPIATADQLRPLVIGRTTIPLSYPLYVDTFYLFTQQNIDGITANFAALVKVQAEAGERLSAVLDDFQVHDPVAFADSIAIHNVTLQSGSGR